MKGMEISMKLRRILSGMICLALLSVAGVASAMKYQLNDNTKLDVDVALYYGIGMRVEDQDTANLAKANANDGDANFKQWDLINNRVSATFDIDLNFGKMGLFARPRAYYDAVYDGTNSNVAPNTLNNGPLYGGPLRDNHYFDSKTQNVMRDKAEFLDYFAYGTFDLAGHELTLRVGNQVVAWGESLFISGISSVMGPVDGTSANAPGIEVKEVLMPVGQVYGLYKILSNLNIAAYYQYNWEKTRLNEEGSYFSTSDMLDDAGRRFLFPVNFALGQAATMDRIKDKDPSDDGQFGVALRYVADWLNDTEFGFYHINFHNKAPEIIAQFGGGLASRDWGVARLNTLDSSSYYLRYSEDIKLWGASFGSNIGDNYVSGEISFRERLPLQVVSGSSPLGFGYTRGNAVQAQLAFIRSMPFAPYADNLAISGEVGWNRVGGYGDFHRVATVDKEAYGGTISISPTYYNVLSGLDVSIPLTYKFNIDGRSGLGGTFSADADQISFGFDFTYKQDYLIGLRYVSYLADVTDDPLCDRDYISLSFKTSF